MSAVLYRGSTCRIKFKPLLGLQVSDLGEPVIGIYQDNFYFSPENVVVDTDHNCIYADLTQEETLQLGEGLETTCQAAYLAQDGSVFRFPSPVLHRPHSPGTTVRSLPERSQ